MKVKELINFYDKYNCHAITFNHGNISKIYVDNNKKIISFISDYAGFIVSENNTVNNFAYDFILHYPNYKLLKGFKDGYIDINSLSHVKLINAKETCIIL